MESVRFGSLPGVKISEKMLAAVGNPQKGLPYIHVAGTNGKGSTAAFLRSVLTEAGYRTGMCISPHLEEFTERFSVDGQEIAGEDFVRFGEWLLRQDFGVEPTMTDYCLLLSLLYFKEKKCDIAIFETGLGGRLDSTNALGIPLVGVITKIGYDHTGILGNTLSEIAMEKAGILKRGCRCVSESQEREVENVLLQHCRERDIPLTFVEKGLIQAKEDGFFYPGAGKFQTGMMGKYQRENALAAALTAKELLNIGYLIPERAITEGIRKAKWPGRMELLGVNPFFLVDGAHNGNGALALAESLRELYPGEKFHFIMGVLADKDYKPMADAVLSLAQDVVTITPEHVRALEGECLADYIRKQGGRARHCENLEDALAECFCGRDTALTGRKNIVFGSLSFIGTTKKILKSLYKI
ncbi:MAG: bifunctional folylpolyglutamate synthase/dihydrofolate synthase [Roseburia sp.]|nr:bifunctional folylpolyglutamate synthase/dihydrofolate synthase [Roseburia sp.]